MAASVYIPHFRGVEHLRSTLAALRGQEADHRAILVDNASQDGSREMVCEEFPEVTIFRLERNLGFGGALNAAVRSHGGDSIVFLNDDIRCETGFLSALLSRLEDGVDMVAGVLTQPDRPGIIDSAGVVADADTLMGFDYLHGAPVTCLESAEPPLGPTGAAALYRRRAFESVGGYDSRIFAYYEDLDLGLRMRSAGHRCELSRDATATHSGSATFGARSSTKFQLTGWSRGYLLRRYGVMKSPPKAAQVLLAEGLICAGQVLRHGTAAGAKGRIQGWRAARDQGRLHPPEEGLVEIPLADRLRLRALRRR